MSLCDLFNLTNLGLSLDICGVILIYFFGVADIFNKRGTQEWVNNSEDNMKIKRANAYSSIGFALLILGFIFQIFANTSL